MMTLFLEKNTDLAYAQAFILLISLLGMNISLAATPPTLDTEYGQIQILPQDSPWNTPVDDLPVHPRSKAFIESIGADKNLHPDFGTRYRGAPNGIPYIVVPPDQARVPVTFRYADESDKGLYPIPANAPIEGGPNGQGDRHVIVIDAVNKKLFEIFKAYPEGAGWRGGSGAIFDLDSNRRRPEGWTSADAAGLPIFPGLVRYDEAAVKKEINHALRFTVVKSQRAYIFPASHYASRDTNPNLPPMGLRFRLKQDYDISSFPDEVQVILTALKKYGMIMADNGSNWFVSGAPDSRWSDARLAAIKQVKGRDFEVVYTGPTIGENRRVLEQYDLGANLGNLTQGGQTSTNIVQDIQIDVYRTDDTDLYVSVDGDDRQNGALESPFRSIQHAVNAAKAGDTLWVLDGLYGGFETIRGGQPGKPIRIQAKGNKVVINNHLKRDQVIIKHDYIEFSGFTVRYGKRSGIAVLEAKNVTIDNNIVGPNAVWGIFSGFAPNIKVTNNEVFESKKEHGIYLSNSRTENDNLIVSNNHVYNNGFNGIQLNGDCKMQGDGTINQAQVRNNRVHDNTYKGLSLVSVNNADIVNNIIYNNGKKGGAGGIHLTDQPGCNKPSFRNNVVNNTIIEPNVAGIRITDQAHSNIIFNNLIVTQRAPFIADEVGYNTISNSSNVNNTDINATVLDWENDDFSLIECSYGINAGVLDFASINAPALDFNDQPRPQGNGIDAGAIESSLNNTDQCPDRNIKQQVKDIRNNILDWFIDSP